MLAILLAGSAGPLGASTGAATAESADGQAVPDETIPEIIVYGERLFPDVQPERSLDEEAIESYGVGTIDELIANLQAEVGNDEDAPLLIVNGERLNDLSEIGEFPVEVLRNVQVLPRGSAVRLGGKSGQRVVSLALKKQVRTVTVSGSQKLATDGNWNATEGETIFTHIRGNTRANIGIRGRDEDRLLESDRGIVQPDPFLPYAAGGNVVGYPFIGGEIDPALSAIAGQIVTVTPVPAGASPTLAGFAANANVPAVTGLGRFRTLRPDSANYEFNGTANTRLAPWLTANAAVRVGRTTTDGIRGLASGLFVLPFDNPASPFSRDVGLLYYGDPLHYRGRRSGGDFNLTFNGTFGRWIGNLNARHSYSRDLSTNDVLVQSGAIPIADGTNPFAGAPALALTSSQASSRLRNSAAQASFTGPLATLPAGTVTATIEGRLASYRLRAKSSFLPGGSAATFNRNEQSVRGALDIPLTSSGGFLKQAGNTSATVEIGRTHFSDVGSLDRYALGLTWEPVAALRLRASIEQANGPPSAQILANPVIITPESRVFDPLTGETVDVTQITGGNPDLFAEKVRIKRLGALLRAVPRLNLQFNAEYTDTDRRNFVSALPEASAAVMLAFPDRFIRDANGVLTAIDLRPVNFDSEREKRFRWGFNLNTKLTNPPPPKNAEARKAPTLLQVSANHTVILSDEIRIRPGIDPVDLLGGGAIGIAGGRVRHQIDGTAAVTAGGLGARVGLLYRGASSLDTRIGGVSDSIRFSPLTIVNLRVYADARRFLKAQKWARGLRLSVDVVNLFNDRQRVRDSQGGVPLQYQPGYRDPLGRTIEFEIRKVF
ncbi:TonB-dependent receptor [Sphingomonas sabuli]|uniref:TonB-dependent receptor n=1 Tax=Sphingomonas sabuli TaxID=2764186 RepID=A0A7G9L046_9SPHN|nr:TonB-dependent receptor [Sphingomonas sabuli]QNM81995.1 TonB-dependent receptor [Sphingomonas sabuli]